MPQVFDRATSQLVQGSPDELQAGLASGKYALDAGAGPVPLKGKDGEVYHAPAAQVANALATGAYSLLAPDEELKHQVAQEEKAKGVWGSLTSGAESALNQATFGVEGAIRDGMDTPEERATREARNKYHSDARFLGGAIGVGGSMLAGGALFKGAELAGQAVARGIMPAAELGQAALASRLAGTVANYATQGVALAAPQAIVQAAFGDPTQAAETLLWGVGAGAVLGGGAELMHSAAGAVGHAAAGILDKEGVSAALDKFGNDRTLKAVGAERSQLNRLSPERQTDLANFVHDEGLIKPGQTRQELGDVIEATHDRYGKQIGDTVRSLDTAFAGPKASEAAEKAIKPGELSQRIREALDSPELRMPMNSDQQAALDVIARSSNHLPTQEVNGQKVVSFAAAQDFVSSLGRKYVNAIKRTANDGGVKGIETVTALDQMKASAYQVARDFLHQAGDAVAIASEKPELVGKLTEAKRAYSKLAELEKFAATLDKQDAGNRMVSLTDFIHMGQGPGAAVAQSVGAGVGAMLGGPAGALIGSQVGRVPGMALDYVAKHWMQDKGLVIMSALAKRAAREGSDVFSSVIASEGAQRLSATMDTIGDTVRRMATSGIADTSSRATAHMSALLGSTTGLTPDQAYSKLGARLNQLVANPGALASATAALSAPYASSAPAVADAYQQKVAASIAYLHAAMPKPPAPPGPFAPQAWSPSAADKLAFHDKASVVADPMAAVRSMEAGTLSDAHIDALRSMYPSTYQKMQAKVLDYSAEHPDVKLPLAERRSVAKFLGAPLDPMTNPDTVRAMQSMYVGQAPQPSQQDASPSQKPVHGKLKDRPSSESGFASTQGAHLGGT